MTKNKQWALGCSAMILTVPPTQCFTGYVIRCLWAWFVTPTWHLAPPSVLAAIGLSTLIMMFQNTPQAPKPTGEESPFEVTSKAVGMMVLKPLLALAFGWLCHVL